MFLIFGIHVALVNASEPTFDDLVLKEVYALNEDFNVPAIQAEISGTKYETETKIVFPNGSVYKENSFILTDVGTYTLIYYFELNGKIYTNEKTFDVKENILKLLLKKQLFKCNYLSNHPIDVYKKKEKLQIKNLFVIFNVIKSIEYKYSIRIIGIESYEKKKENGYSLERKFHWFIKFVDYIIILYLSEDLIISFSQFIKRKSMKDLIETFDKEKDFSLSYFYYQENEEKFVRKIIYIVENVIYNIINKK